MGPQNMRSSVSSRHASVAHVIYLANQYGQRCDITLGIKFFYSENAFWAHGIYLAAVPKVATVKNQCDAILPVLYLVTITIGQTSAGCKARPPVLLLLFFCP